MLVANPPTSKPAFADLLRSIPLPRGQQWYLVAYRWLLVAAGIFTVVVTWDVWQVRSGPRFEMSPMLPLWDWLPQVDLGWMMIAALLTILIRPRVGLTAVGILWFVSVLMDRTRLQPHYQIGFLILATLPSVSAQLTGRASLIALWFWAGCHKLLIDFIKPHDMVGFKTEVIPNDLMRLFPPERFPWSTHSTGVALGWTIAIAETTLGLMCLFPHTRKAVGVIALFLHAGILFWNCQTWDCNLLLWNISLMFAGLVLISPWREWPWTSWMQSNWPARAASIALLVCPAGYYLNWTAAYLSHCVYVPNTPYAELFRPGESPQFVPFLCYNEVHFPLPPSQEISEQWFNKIRRPGDVLIIHDPRPWAQSRSMNGRQLTDTGEIHPDEHTIVRYPDGTKLEEGETVDGRKQGLWVRWHPNGKISEWGLLIDGQEQGPWTFWFPDGKKAMRGNYEKGQAEGTWHQWTPDGEETTLEFHNGEPVTPNEK
jgi:hypothetical protein